MAVPVAATARAVVAMVAVVTAPVVVDTAAAVAVPAVAADTVVVAARAAVVAVTAVKPFRNVEGLSCHLYQPSRARKRPFCFCYSLHSSTRPIHLR